MEVIRNECISKLKVVQILQKAYTEGRIQAKDGLVSVLDDINTADVQPVKKSKWCPPLMGQGKCDTYCERCHGKIMRNSTGIFEETLFCPHCGARMDAELNEPWQSD